MLLLFIFHSLHDFGTSGNILLLKKSKVLINMLLLFIPVIWYACC